MASLRWPVQESLGRHIARCCSSGVRCRFSDFLRVGVPLAVIMWIGFSIVLPLLCDNSGQ